MVDHLLRFSAFRILIGVVFLLTFRKRRFGEFFFISAALVALIALTETLPYKGQFCLIYLLHAYSQIIYEADINWINLIFELNVCTLTNVIYVQE